MNEARAEADRMVDEMEAAGAGGGGSDDYKGVDSGEPEGAPEDPAWAKEVEVSADGGDSVMGGTVAEAAGSVADDTAAAAVINTLEDEDHIEIQGKQNETNV